MTRRTPESRQALARAGIALPEAPQRTRLRKRVLMCVACGAEPRVVGRKLGAKCVGYLAGVVGRGGDAG